MKKIVTLMLGMALVMGVSAFGADEKKDEKKMEKKGKKKGKKTEEKK